MTDDVTGSGAVGSRALGGGRTLALGTVVERLARLGRNMVLARIIAPDQFGIMSLTLATIAVFEAITEVGVKQAVIQNKRGDTPEFMNVAWWFSVVRGVLVAGLAVLLAGPIAGFYGEPELRTLLLVAPLTVLLTGLTSPRIYALQRQFRFGATMWSVQGAGLLGTLFTIVLGLYLQNVWALLWGAIFEAFARFVLSFLLAPMRPRFTLDRESLRDLVKFSKGMAGLALLTLLVMQGDALVLGRLATAEQLGLYTLAIALAAFPLSLFSKVVQPLLVPIFASQQDDHGELRASVLQLARLVWLFGLPMATVMGFAAPHLLVLLYGRSEFTSVAPAFALYTVFTVAYMSSMVTFSVYLAIARPELQRRFTVVRALLVLVLLYPLIILMGGTGAALALLLSMVGAMAVQLSNLRRIIELPIGSYLRTPLAGLLAAAAAAIPCAALLFVTGIDGWVRVLLAGLIGLLTWGVLLWRERRSVALLRAGHQPKP